ncbi:MAG: HPr family phosphocarrier protein [Lachnospiraceae bacterium]
MIKHIVTIKLKTIDNAKKFVESMHKLKSDVDVYQGRHIVDAKSILGLFSLNLTQEMEVTLFDEWNETACFLQNIQKYVV